MRASNAHLDMSAIWTLTPVAEPGSRWLLKSLHLAASHALSESAAAAVDQSFLGHSGDQLPILKELPMRESTTFCN